MNKKVIFWIDEVWRGCLAWPLVVCAFLYIEWLNKKIQWVTDSKKLTKLKREKIYKEIIKSSYFSIWMAESTTIDKLWLSTSLKNCIIDAIENLKKISWIENPFLMLDWWTPVIEGYKQEHHNKWDAKFYEIWAASIIAKVYRDNIMKEYSIKYPEYGFDTHVGYGTKKHIEAIHKHGILDIHRKTFKPIKNLL